MNCCLLLDNISVRHLSIIGGHKLHAPLNDSIYVFFGDHVESDMLYHLHSLPEYGVQPHEVLDLHQVPCRLEVTLAEHNHDGERSRVAGQHMVQSVDQVNGCRADALWAAGVHQEQDSRGPVLFHI